MESLSVLRRPTKLTAASDDPQLQYKIIISSTASANRRNSNGISIFERQVNEHLRRGWRPVGGVSIEGLRAAQALERTIIPSYDLLGEEEALLGMPARSAGLEEVFSSSASSRGGSVRRKRSVRKNKTRKQRM